MKAIWRAGALAALLAGWVGASETRAGPDRINILLGSEHLGATRDFEEFNPGLFLTWTNLMWKNRLDLTVGAFRNSYGDGSAAVSAAYPLIRTEAWGLELFGALAWYPGNGDQFGHSIGDMVPIAGVQARFHYLYMQAIPAGGDGVDATLTLGLTFPVK
ncbi:hypothetical protein [Primorskyibacter sp. S87]|uniref:hypothetical protein n=1 Tax=Primorskyibacter sp. S87 TaxID=3415126 RepID=UPI003C7B9C83